MRIITVIFEFTECTMEFSRDCALNSDNELLTGSFGLLGILIKHKNVSCTNDQRIYVGVTTALN